MAKLSSALIKLGHSDEARFQSWRGQDPIPISYSTFSQAMASPGYPHYSSKKSIREKWIFLQDLGFASRPKKSDGVEVAILNPVLIAAYIQDSIPPEIKSDPAKLHQYLKTGEI